MMMSDELPTDNSQRPNGATRSAASELPDLWDDPAELPDQAETVAPLPDLSTLQAGEAIAEPPTETIDPNPTMQAVSRETLPESEQTRFIDQPSDRELEVPKSEVSEPGLGSLKHQAQALRQEIQQAEANLAQARQQLAETQAAMAQLVQTSLQDLEQRRQNLQISVEQLERRQERIRNEMRTTFAGASQDLAIRVQSFKDYLVGSLQDLAISAEQLELVKPQRVPERVAQPPETKAALPQSGPPRFAESEFQDQTRKIRGLIDQYRNRPDYYGPSWQLRRTFEPIHAERVSNWFFTQSGRGALRTMGSRLQNILVASAIVSILYALYRDRLRPLVLAQSPERLGEWRRGLQDCLGITRSDFGPDRGIGLFEDPYALCQKADRLVKDGLIPLIVVDETEAQIDLAILQYPLWLAFAPNPQAPRAADDYDYFR